MIIENQNNIKKQYQSPCLEVIQLDNHIVLETLSPGVIPPVEPTSKNDQEAFGYKEYFPDAPTSDNPFGGSSPNYK